jgi:hypothetical protein
MALKVRDSWLHGKKEFFKVMRKAKDLGRYTSGVIERISKIKNSVSTKILEGHRKIASIQKTEDSLRNAQNNLRIAKQNYDIAMQNKDLADAKYKKAEYDRQVAFAKSLTYQTTEHEKANTDPIYHTTCIPCDKACHEACGLDFMGLERFDHLTGCSCMNNGTCKVCKCPYSRHRHRFDIWKNVNKERENLDVKAERETASGNHVVCQQVRESVSKDVSSRAADKGDKTNIRNDVQKLLDSMKIEKDALQQEIIELYVKLGEVSMSSINFHIAEYYRYIISKETNPDKLAKLLGERDFYVEQVKLYKQRMAQNN